MREGGRGRADGCSRVGGGEARRELRSAFTVEAAKTNEK